jgi:hypothetical protein
MRRLLGRLGVRGGVAVGLAAAVLLTVAIAQLAGGGSDRGPYFPDSGTQPFSTADPTAGDDSEVGPTQSAYPDDPNVRAVATAFAAAWLRRELAAATWHAGIAALATKSLAQSLEGVDPSRVPATRTTGEARLSLRTDLVAEATIPVDTGTLVLTLRKEGNRWLVDGVDWERA